METKEERISALMGVVKEAIEVITQKRNSPNEFNFVYDLADDARFAIYELKRLLREDEELYVLVRQAHLTLVNSMNIIYTNMNMNNSPFKKGKDHIYTLLSQYKEKQENRPK